VPVAEQVARADAAAAPPRPSLGAATPRLGMGHRGSGPRGRGRLDGPPPELLAIGVVDEPAPVGIASPNEAPTAPEPNAAIAAETSAVTEAAPAEPRAPRGAKKRGRRGTPASVERQSAETAPAAASEPAPAAPAPRKSRARTAAKTAHRRARAKKTTPKTES
jgi:hypothetical protein